MKKMLLLAGILIASGASAAESNYYVVGAIGQTRLTYPQSATDAALQTIGMTGVVSVANNNPSAYRLQLGYRIDERWAIEAGFTDMGQVSYRATGTFAAAPAVASENAKISAWNVTGVGKLPVSNAVSLLGKLGLTRVETTDAAIAPGVGTAFWINSNVIRTGLTYGLGLSIDINKQFSARGDMDSYDTGTATGRINVWTLGLSYRF